MTIIVTFIDGKVMTLVAAANLAGLSDHCVRKRYAKGMRGEDLFRPSNRGRYHKVGKRPESILRGEGVAAKSREQEAARRERQSMRKAEQAARLAAMKAAHEAAFARPLIDAKLLKPREHKAIAERVRNCGQLNWRSDGGAMY